MILATYAHLCPSVGHTSAPWPMPVTARGLSHRRAERDEHKSAQVFSTVVGKLPNCSQLM